MLRLPGQLRPHVPGREHGTPYAGIRPSAATTCASRFCVLPHRRTSRRASGRPPPGSSAIPRTSYPLATAGNHRQSHWHHSAQSAATGPTGTTCGTTCAASAARPATGRAGVRQDRRRSCHCPCGTAQPQHTPSECTKPSHRLRTGTSPSASRRSWVHRQPYLRLPGHPGGLI